VRAPAALFLLAFAAAPLAAAPAELRSLRGTVEIRKAGSAVWVAVSSGARVGDGDSLRTAENARAEMAMPQGHRLTLRQKTTLRMDSSDPKDTRFSLTVGRVRAFVAKLKKRDKFEMRTPVAVASVRGTVFEMDVREDFTSRLSVLEGDVGYKDLAGLAGEFVVSGGQSVVADAGGVGKPETVPPDVLLDQEPAEPEKTPEGEKPGEKKEEKKEEKADERKKDIRGRRDKDDPKDKISAREEARQEFRVEMEKEINMDAFRDFIQTDVTQELRQNEYQKGTALIDAFGRRVRMEEYIARPAKNQYSFISLNTREDRFDRTQFDVYARDVLPEDLGSVNLFFQEKPMDNWAEKTHYISSNDKGDYYREWRDGGRPVFMRDKNFHQVVFDHWYIEVKGDGEAVLLSHWVPHSDFINGRFDATSSRDELAFKNDGLLDIPSGYNEYGDTTGYVGDERYVDGFDDKTRMAYFADGDVAKRYRLSEGYSRESRPLYDDVFTMDPAAQEKAGKFSREDTYFHPDNKIFLRTDTYTLTDEGGRVPLGKLQETGFGPDGLNVQRVFSSSLLPKRSIDVIFDNAALLKQAGHLER
jgi:hypothetical protein